MLNYTKYQKILGRTIEPALKRIARGFPVLLLTGMRQIGKSWLMEQLAGTGRRYVSLDDLRARALAKRDPERFIAENPPPCVYDEAQYAPELFTYIKIYADKQKKDGLFWLTGSQKYRLMQGIQESLAGRLAILNMLGLSYREKIARPFGGKPFLPARSLTRKNPLCAPLTPAELYKFIWQGSFPKLVTNKNTDRKVFYDSYIQSYIERDVKDFYNIESAINFYNFLVAAAARTGQLLNYNDLARDVHIDNRTAKLWLSVLERSGIVRLLYPYSSNLTSRVVKTPKLYFLDTGLAAYLCAWDSPDSLRNGAQSGAILETYVFAEILKSYWHNGDSPNIYFYRDQDQKEIDFVLEKNRTLYPIEVKKTAAPDSRDVRHFRTLERFKKNIGTGAVLCLYGQTIALPRQDALSVPVWEI
ncbi:ATPase [Candidatus Termititenax aidoneus]|uniref:ATPase n=1 Tax=Termititenax aidoneus TaxID=2218524 RepID=A0A388TEK7_TERA1|nr:ATPase [Candidatus Termititenax aidoneus]